MIAPPGSAPASGFARKVQIHAIDQAVFVTVERRNVNALLFERGNRLAEQLIYAIGVIAAAMLGRVVVRPAREAEPPIRRAAVVRIQAFVRCRIRRAVDHSLQRLERIAFVKRHSLLIAFCRKRDAKGQDLRRSLKGHAANRCRRHLPTRAT